MNDVGGVVLLFNGNGIVRTLFDQPDQILRGVSFIFEPVNTCPTTAPAEMP